MACFNFAEAYAFCYCYEFPKIATLFCLGSALTDSASFSLSASSSIMVPESWEGGVYFRCLIKA